MDNTLLLAINQGWAHGGLDRFFAWVSTRVAFALPVALAMLALWWRAYRNDGVRLWLMMLLVIGLADVSGARLKDQFLQTRPCYDNYQQVRQPGHPPHTRCGESLHGMPSNHAINYFAMAAFVSVILRRRVWTITVFSLAIVVGLSRIYLGKHYPSQVLVGGLFGIILGCAMAWLTLKYSAFAQRVRARPTPL